MCARSGHSGPDKMNLCIQNGGRTGCWEAAVPLRQWTESRAAPSDCIATSQSGWVGKTEHHQERFLPSSSLMAMPWWFSGAQHSRKHFADCTGAPLKKWQSWTAPDRATESTNSTLIPGRSLYSVLPLGMDILGLPCPVKTSLDLGSQDGNVWGIALPCWFLKTGRTLMQRMLPGHPGVRVFRWDHIVDLFYAGLLTWLYFSTSYCCFEPKNVPFLLTPCTQYLGIRKYRSSMNLLKWSVSLELHWACWCFSILPVNIFSHSESLGWSHWPPQHCPSQKSHHSAAWVIGQE